ncbi:MAG TPA: YggS family pyridoxal phosphate-dependent enzyme [Candidatus Binatia bacterium]|nr:YggS family pyridoxal phosphate-dependent enzyme [Candidatus Binatia bacterium]
MADVSANYRTIVAGIHRAAEKAGRDARQIKLLAAAKSQSVEAISAAIGAGVTLIGENYVQEANAKRQRIRVPVEWHMIGHLQRNKARAAVELFDVIESLDSAALARELDKEGARRGKPVRTLIEVNLGGEESKGGISKERVRALLEEVGGLPHITVEGLMTVPPFRKNPEDVRPYFRELAALLAKLGELRLPNVALRELSMGMTHDYQVAIEEGATVVRIGTALFGPRI